MVEKNEYTCKSNHNYENYCRKCKVLFCSLCAHVHIDHIDKLIKWKSFIEEYLGKCANYLLQTNIMTQSAKSKNL